MTHEHSIMPVIYRHAESKDVDAIVRLHVQAFPGFFLTSLGRGFLRLLYQTFLDIDGGICIIAQGDRQVLGVVVGASHPDLFFPTVLRKRGVFFALAAIPGLLHHPLLVVSKCLWALFYRGEQPDSLPGAGLMSSVAVAPEVSGQGIGQQLVNVFCEELGRRDAQFVYLITDETDNDRVNRFYHKCGFHLVDTFERFERRRMNRWARNIR